MQTSKSFFVICAIVFLVSAPNLLAAESEAQAKAREALHKKMSELDAQEKGAPAPAPTAPTLTPPAVVAPAPASPAAAPAPRAVDDEASARAREAMRQKMRELDAPQKVARPAATPAQPPQATAPAPVTRPQTPPPAPVARPKTPPPVAPAPAPVKAAPAQPTYAPVRQPADDEATARAREALRQKMNELNAQQQPAPAPATPAPPPQATTAAPVAPPQTPPPVAPVPAPANASPPQATAAAPVAPPQTPPPVAPAPAPARPDFKPIEAPPSPISGSKEARLADLLRQYKTDEITPEQYHKQRVKILAEP